MTTPPFVQRQAETNIKRIEERLNHLEALPMLRFRTATRETSSSTTLDHSFDGTLFTDTSGGAITATLPASTNQAGRVFVVMDLSGDAGTNAVTVDTTGAETIDGDASVTIEADYGALILQTNGSNWFIIANVGSPGSLITPIQDPPTTTAWLDPIIPDTIGDGSGTLLQNYNGTATFFIDFSIATASTQITSYAPIGAKLAYGVFVMTDTAGLGNRVDLRWAPKAAQNPPTFDLMTGLATTIGLTQFVWMQLDANQIVSFRKVGPAGAFNSGTVTYYNMGYAI